MRVWSANFENLAKNWFPWQCPLSDRKMNERLMKPSHTTTKPENLAVIGPVNSEVTGENLTTEKEKKTKKTAAQHLARSAGRPSEL